MKMRVFSFSFLIALAPVAWLLGYRAHYSRYCTRLEARADLKVS